MEKSTFHFVTDQIWLNRMKVTVFKSTELCLFCKLWKNISFGILLHSPIIGFNVIEIEPIPDDSVGKYRAEGVEWAI